MARSEVRMPMFPQCWDSCGNCAQGDVVVAEVRAKVGEQMVVDDVVIVLETGKVALDIASPYAGKVMEVLVAVGDKLQPQQILCILESA